MCRWYYTLIHWKADFLFQRAAQFFTIITPLYLVLGKAEWNCSRASQMSPTSVNGWDIWYYQGADTQGIRWTCIIVLLVFYCLSFCPLEEHPSDLPDSFTEHFNTDYSVLQVLLVVVNFSIVKRSRCAFAISLEFWCSNSSLAIFVS